MKALNFTILYVSDPAASAAFYQRLLGLPPVEQSATFAMFVLSDGGRLGLWRRDGVRPAATPGSSQSELVLSAASREEVDSCHQQWQQWGINILQQSVSMDFGYTFTAADDDGHRLRVYVYEE